MKVDIDFDVGLICSCQLGIVDTSSYLVVYVSISLYKGLFTVIEPGY